MPVVQNGATCWASSQMRLASLNFLSLGSWVYFPQRDTPENVRRQVVNYLNIVLVGDLHRLPREATPETKGIEDGKSTPSAIKSLSRYVPLMLHASLPIAAYPIVMSVLDWTPSAAAHSALVFSYAIWLVWGIVAFIERLSPDTREFVTDIAKMILLRK